LAAKYLTSGEDTIALDASGLDAEAVASVLTGLRLRAWRYDIYRTKLKDEQKCTLAKVVVFGAPDGAEAAWRVEQAVAEGVEFTRELVSEPPNVIYPESFVERCQARFKGTGVEVSFLEEAEMRKLGMGALLGVNQGSAKAPRLLVLKWLGGAKNGRPTVFVGKGVTFDTGGISIKPAAGMEDMKWDMAGSAAVIGTMRALAARKAKVNAVGVVGLVENMPSGTAQRPGDIVTSMSGQTIEVLNTDAEGRLILGDALWYAQQQGVTHMVDVATLTGAMVIALGRHVSGLFGQPQSWVETVQRSAVTAGDRVWQLPIYEEAKDQLRSEIADMINSAGRPGGSVTAAAFLREFAGDIPWAHIDIAGTAWAEVKEPYQPKGATGVAIRTLIELGMTGGRPRS